MVNNSVQYPSLDDLCKVFFANGVKCFINGRFVGHALGQNIKKWFFCDDLSEISVHSDQERQIADFVIRARQDKSPAAEVFLTNLNALIGIFGNKLNDSVCVIPSANIESFFACIAANAHDKDAVRYALAYIRSFCYSYNDTDYYSVKSHLAHVATQWDCLKCVDYGFILLQNSHRLSDQKPFIKPFIESARRDLTDLLSSTDNSARSSAVKLCNMVAMRIADMTLPLDLIDAVHQEFLSVKRILQTGGKVGKINDSLSMHTDKELAKFFNFSNLQKTNILSATADKNSRTDSTKPTTVHKQNLNVAPKIEEILVDSVADDDVYASDVCEAVVTDYVEEVDSHEDTKTTDIVEEPVSDICDVNTVEKSVSDICDVNTVEDPISGIGFYSEKKRVGFLQGLFGRRR